MPDYKIKEVQTHKELMQFIQFPDELYKDCPQYVPALHSDQVRSLTKAAPLDYCSHKLWMVLDGERVVGRISGMVNPRYNERYGRHRSGPPADRHRRGLGPGAGDGRDPRPALL